MDDKWTEAAALDYARSANAAGKGLFGPSLKRLGLSARDDICDDLVRRGIMRIVLVGTNNQRGYWLVETAKP